MVVQKAKPLMHLFLSLFEALIPKIWFNLFIYLSNYGSNQWIQSLHTHKTLIGILAKIKQGVII
jgi:hypothetical protein